MSDVRILHGRGLVALAIACACGMDPPHAATPATPRPSPATPRDAVPTPVTPTVASPLPVTTADDFEVRERVTPSPDSIVIESAGAEPRRAIAAQSRVGDRQTLRLSLGMSVAMDLGSRTVPAQTVPPLLATIVAETTAVDAEGVVLSIRVTEVATTETPDTTSRVREAMTRTAERLRGTKGTVRVAPDGRLLAFDLAGSAAVADPPQAALEPELGGLAAALQELLPAVPREPLGDGAKWSSVRHVRRDAIRFEQAGTWTLVLVDDVPTLSLQSSHIATTDVIAGMVDASSGTTTARIVLGDRPLPARATATISTNTRADLELIGAAQRVSLRTVLTLELSDVSADR